jgi:hypothetical protein
LVPLSRLEEGDLVAHLDGTPVHERGCSGLSDYSETDNVRLTIQRDEATIEIDVAVEDLVP